MYSKTKKLYKLDIFKIPTYGIHLIESSAGTGKTSTIVLLYLRLLLGIDKKIKHAKKFLVQEILVVTFTNATKEELYIRIKNSIYNLYLACLNNNNNEKNIFTMLLNEITDKNDAAGILFKAYHNIHNAAIHTIHSFCRNMLQSYSLNINYAFEEKIIENEDNLYIQATQDFWRSCFYKLPEEIAKIVFQECKNPEYLLQNIQSLLYIKSLNFTKTSMSNVTLMAHHKKNINMINNFKKLWMKNHPSIFKIVNNVQTNKKIYSKSNVSKWINNITIWANTITKNYHIPHVLKYFTKSNMEKNIKQNLSLKNLVFIKTEKILKKNMSLKNIILLNALRKIPKIILKEKQKQSLLGFDDLLNKLLKILIKNKNIQKIISNQYPIAFIDEFQDTDINQYKIFNLIYKNDKKTALFLFGDPKQAIYSFRGADIFSYLYAKDKIQNHYYLETNWRSSENMCRGINILFSSYLNPFIFKRIPFIPILPNYKNSNMNFKLHGVLQTAIRFFIPKKKEMCAEEYQIWIAKQCANEISYWLHCARTGNATIVTKSGKKKLTESDIVVLVKNKIEEKIIRNALESVNIHTIYSSHTYGVFQTNDAKELLCMLQSILDPTNEKILQQAVLTDIFQSILYENNHILNCKNPYLIAEKLYKYHKIWNKTGIFRVIESIIISNIQINKSETTHQKNINLLHIAEILQKKSILVQKKTALMRWLQKKILQKNISSSNEKIRFINKLTSIKIVTIHKSKGLEYPIVWIPFMINFHPAKLPIYHDKKNFKIFYDPEHKKKNLELADNERLAEDMRFLYVALTRSIVHCSIGITCIIKTKKIKEKNSKMYHNALEYLIKRKKYVNYDILLKKINSLSIYPIIDIKHDTINCKNYYKCTKKCFFSERRVLKKDIKYTYSITSFTQLKKENIFLTKKNNQYRKENFFIENIKQNKKKLTIHNFPEGKKSGILIHDMLKKIDFMYLKKPNWYSDFLNMYNFSINWTKTLISCINDLVNIPLNHNNIILSKLNQQEYIKELEFFIPIKNILHSQQLNNIIQSFDKISHVAPKFLFDPVTGILKGFIDLVFVWKHKYYILDYKFNWLGENNKFYSKNNIIKEIIKNRYDVQYQIYAIALHKYLKNKVKNYNYNTHFGGIFYIFLRGINKKNQDNGIFYTLPNYLLIKKLSILIS